MPYFVNKYSKKKEESNFFFRKEVMECPITLSRYEIPCVLPCGHTVDHAALLLLKVHRCPLCQERFAQHEPNINWALVRLMDLDVPNSTSLFPRISHMKRYEAKMRYRKRLDPIVEQEMTSLIQDIKEASDRGCHELQYVPLRRFKHHRLYDQDMRHRVQACIEKELVRLGYGISYRPIYGWCCGISYEISTVISWD